MLGYAKLFREKVHAEGRAEGRVEGRTEVYAELREAIKAGKTLEEVLATHDAENGSETVP